MPANPAVFRIEERHNPPRHRPPGAFLMDDYHRPEVAELRQRYDLEGRIAGCANRLEAALAVSNWLHGINTFGSTPERIPLNALRILPAILERGMTFECSSMPHVYAQCCQALGFGVRLVWLCWDGAIWEGSGHHGCTEIWIDGLDRWVYIDALHGFHYEKDGVPLSMVEIHNHCYSGDIDNMFLVYGPDRERTPVPNDTSTATMAVYEAWRDRDEGRPYPTPGLFHWMAVNLNNAMFAQLHQNTENWYRPMFVRTPNNADKVWYQRLHGRPTDEAHLRTVHWIYWAGDSLEVWSPYQVNFPLNQVHVDWARTDAGIELSFETTCPNFAAFEVSVDDEAPNDVEEPRYVWRPQADGSRLTVRTRNLFGVCGTPTELRAVAREETR